MKIDIEALKATTYRDAHEDSLQYVTRVELEDFEDDIWYDSDGDEIALWRIVDRADDNEICGLAESIRDRADTLFISGETYSRTAELALDAATP